MKAIQIKSRGAAGVLKIETQKKPSLGPNDALVEMRAIGVNYIDVYMRSGIVKVDLPFTPGIEGAGVVTATGSGVNQVSVGDLVGYTGSLGSYAEQTVVKASQLIPLPSGITTEVAATCLSQGMTAHYLAHSTFPITRGHTVLIHAGAGGVGLILIQMAKRLGAYVFTTVSSIDKAELATRAGADHSIIYTEDDFRAVIHKETGGEGVDVVYDSVGNDTFDDSRRALKRRGFLVLFGNSSGLVPPIPPIVLRERSVFLTRPALEDYTATRGELLQRAGEVFNAVILGHVKLNVFDRYPLENASDAHRDIESRKTSGKLLLIP